MTQNNDRLLVSQEVDEHILLYAGLHSGYFREGIVNICADDTFGNKLATLRVTQIK